MDSDSSWFVLQTDPKCETKVEQFLTHKGYECLVPMYRQKRQWCSRVIEVNLPLFPMYVFCHFTNSAIGKAIVTPHVKRIVGFGGQPVEVAAKEINALKLLSQSRLLREPWAYIPDGTLVQIETGPLAGVQGFLYNGEDRQRLIITVSLLQRSVAVQLDKNTILTIVEAKPHDNSGTSDCESSFALKLIKSARISCV
jgi:transcription antitermination factor NusG